jgi:hypothetical protein
MIYTGHVIPHAAKLNHHVGTSEKHARKINSELGSEFMHHRLLIMLWTSHDAHLSAMKTQYLFAFLWEMFAPSLGKPNAALKLSNHWILLSHGRIGQEH